MSEREGLWREVLIEKYGIWDFDKFVLGQDIRNDS